jgi:hypothetical protein
MKGLCSTHARYVKLTIILFLAATLAACAQVDQAELCGPFFSALDEVPHTTLTIATGHYVSDWDGAAYEGCEVEFQTNDSLSADHQIPEFDAIRDSEMYRLGWRMSDGIGADGPGSGIFGIEKESTRCVIRWEQPAWIDDDGVHRHSDTFTMKVQCRED